MGLLRKSMSVGLTGGMVGYRSASEKQARRAKQAAKYTKQMARDTRRMADAQAAAAGAERQYLRQQTEFVASQQKIAEGEAHERWLEAQPVTCAHCRTSSPPGTNFCPQCGSPDVAYRGPEADGAPTKAEPPGSSQSGPVALGFRDGVKAGRKAPRRFGIRWPKDIRAAQQAAAGVMTIDEAR